MRDFNRALVYDENAIKGPLERVMRWSKIASGIKDTTTKAEYLAKMQIDDSVFFRLKTKGENWSTDDYFTGISWELKNDTTGLKNVFALKTSAFDAIRVYIDNRLVYTEGYVDSITGKLETSYNSDGIVIPLLLPDTIAHLLSVRFLNKNFFAETSEILNATREEVIQALSRNNLHDDEVKDGMDASLALIHFSQRKLYWSGPNNPIWISRTGDVIELSGDKQPIGKSPVNKPFTHHEMDLMDGDCLYLFTDGFQDQFGGDRNRKFSKKRMRELILSLSSRAITEQKEKLALHFSEWKVDQDQIDDVCVIGIRIS